MKEIIKKLFFTFALILLIMVLIGGKEASVKDVNATSYESNGSYDVSSNGKVASWNFQSELPKDNILIYKGDDLLGITTNTDENYLQFTVGEKVLTNKKNTNICVPVPSASQGNIKVTSSMTNSSRIVNLLLNTNAIDQSIQASQSGWSVSFTSDNIFTINSKNYLVLAFVTNQEFKATAIEVSLSTGEYEIQTKHQFIFMDGNTQYCTKNVIEGETINYSPKKWGYNFVGFYTDSSLETAYDINAVVTQGKTLYIKWEEWTDEITSSTSLDQSMLELVYDNYTYLDNNTLLTGTNYNIWYGVSTMKDVVTLPGETEAKTCYGIYTGGSSNGTYNRAIEFSIPKTGTLKMLVAGAGTSSRNLSLKDTDSAQLLTSTSNNSTLTTTSVIEVTYDVSAGNYLTYASNGVYIYGIIFEPTLVELYKQEAATGDAVRFYGQINEEASNISKVEFIFNSNGKEVIREAQMAYHTLNSGVGSQIVADEGSCLVAFTIYDIPVTSVTITCALRVTFVGGNIITTDDGSYESANKFTYKGVTYDIDNNLVIDYVDLLTETCSYVPSWNAEGFKGKWNYIDGVFLKGLISLYYETNDEAYKDFALQYVNYYVDEDGNFLYLDDDGNSTGAVGYVATELDTVCESMILYDLLNFATTDSRYQTAIEYTFNHLTELQDRTITGNWSHKFNESNPSNSYNEQIWLDGFYMAIPFYARYASVYGNKTVTVNGQQTTIYDDIVNQYQQVRDLMYNEQLKLYYHGYDCNYQDSTNKAFWSNETTGLSDNFWLRSIGWYITSLVDSIEYFPQGDNKTYLTNLYKEAIDGVLGYQDEESKLFYQVVDKGNYSLDVDAYYLLMLRSGSSSYSEDVFYVYYDETNEKYVATFTAPSGISYSTYSIANKYHEQFAVGGEFYSVRTTGKATVSNYLETSGSLLIAYDLIKGYNMGYLTEDYAIKGIEIFESVCQTKLVINSDGTIALDDAIIAGGLGANNKPYRDGSISYYLSEPNGQINDGKVTGPFMMVYTELLKLSNI